MEKLQINAETRDKAGVKGALSKIRAQKKIPAVIYGADKKPLALTVTEKDLAAIQKAGGNVIVEISLADAKEQAIIKEIQYDVVKDTPIHIDFQRISMNKMLETVVPVILTGECEYIKTHGVMVDHTAREITVKCLPADIPHHIEADISKLTLDTHITVSDLKLPKGVSAVDDGGKMIVHLIVPKEEVVAAPAAPAAGTEAAQPELSAAKGKKEEESAAAVAGAAKPAAAAQPKK